MPCSTFLPRHDRRLAVVDRWNRPKPEKGASVGSGSIGIGGIAGGITELPSQSQYQQSMGQHWSLQGGGVVPSGVGLDPGLEEYKRYYGPIDPELGVSTDQQKDKPSANPRGVPKASGMARQVKSSQQSLGHLIPKPPPPLPSSPRRPPFWRRGSLSQVRRKGSGGPLYENILPLGRRGRYGPSEGRRSRRPPPPLPVPLSSPTHTPTTPSSPCRFYSSCTSGSSSESSESSSSSSSSSASLSRSNSLSSCSSESSYNSSLSFRYRAGDREFTPDDDYDSDQLTEESSLLLGSRRKIRSRRMSSRSLPCSPPPPPVPPRKPRPQRDYVRERTSSQLAQLQEWWASWADRERGRRESTTAGGGLRDEKRQHKERERERKRRKKGRKKKKREERERERERKRRKAKKKRKKDDKVRGKRERKRSEQEGGDSEKREDAKTGTPDYTSYPPLRRESFRKKSESSIRSYGWNIPPADDERKDEKDREEGVEESRGKDRLHRRRNSKQYHSSSSKPSTSVKFWGGGNQTSDSIPSAFLPLLPVSSKRRKSKSSDREGTGKEGERRPLLGRNDRGDVHSKEGLSFHEWESDVDEDDSDQERRKGERGKRRTGGRSMSDEERDKVIGIYSDDDGSSGEFGKFERYWEDHEGRAVGGIGGGGWFFSTYPSREKIGSVTSRDDLFLERGDRWGTAESGWGSGGGGGGDGGERGWGSGSHWPPPPLTPPPPRRYWSVDKLHIQDEKKSKRKYKDKSRGHAACASYQSPRRHPQSAKWSRAMSRSQEELYHHCQSFGAPMKPKHDSSSSSKPDRSQNPAGSQSNLSAQQRGRPDRDRDRGRQSSPPSGLLPNLPPAVPALPAPPSTSHSIHAPPPTSSSSVSSPSVVSSTPGAPPSSSMASASAKLQYQRLRSAPQPQRFPQSPHLPLKAKSMCSRRGSAHFSSVESEV